MQCKAGQRSCQVQCTCSKVQAVLVRTHTQATKLNPAVHGRQHVVARSPPCQRPPNKNTEEHNDISIQLAVVMTQFNATICAVLSPPPKDLNSCHAALHISS